MCLFLESDGEWRTIRGKFLAINAASMSCACPRSPKGLSPAAHLADGTTDLILVRKCSRFDFLRHLLRHTSKDDQVTTVEELQPLQCLSSQVDVLSTGSFLTTLVPFGPVWPVLRWGPSSASFPFHTAPLPEWLGPGVGPARTWQTPNL